MTALKQSFRIDRLALMLSLAGVLFGVFIAIVGSIYERNLTVHAYGVFVCFSVAAIVLGAITRTSAIGRAALITSTILLIGSLGFMT